MGLNLMENDLVRTGSIAPDAKRVVLCLSANAYPIKSSADRDEPCPYECVVQLNLILHASGQRLAEGLHRSLRIGCYFDESLRVHLRDEMERKGVDLQFNSDIRRIDKQADGSLKATLADGRVLETDCVFYATGRRPMLDNLGLENTAVELDERGYIKVDSLYRTADPFVLAIGDVIGRMQLTPVALAEGMAVARRLFRPEEYRPLSYELIPTAVFCLPNIGTVGLSEEQAREKYRVKVFESRFRPMKLSLTDNQERTLMKLVVEADSDRVLGCHMIGPDAGEIIQGLAVAMKAGASKRDFDETLGIHPTAAEEFVTMRTERQ